jgi:hypothetical protein
MEELTDFVAIKEIHGEAELELTDLVQPLNVSRGQGPIQAMDCQTVPEIAWQPGG